MTTRSTRLDELFTDFVDDIVNEWFDAIQNIPDIASESEQMYELYSEFEDEEETDLLDTAIETLIRTAQQALIARIAERHAKRDLEEVHAIF